MSKVLIIKNITREGPGLLQDVLEQANVAYDIVDLDKGEVLPPLSGYKAMVVLGGPDSANDTTDKMIKELTYVREALAAGMPYLGICLGLQVLVKAAGGKIVPSEHKEVGFLAPDGVQNTVELTDVGKTDSLLAGISDKPEVFQLHGEAVDMTDSMTLLASGSYCRNQIVKVADNAYGIQSHFELTPDMLAVWAAEDPDLTPLDSEQLQQSFAAIRKAYTQTGETLMRNFLNIASLL